MGHGSSLGAAGVAPRWGDVDSPKTTGPLEGARTRATVRRRGELFRLAHCPICVLIAPSSPGSAPSRLSRWPNMSIPATGSGGEGP
jgi:hypothetical protein